MPARKASKSAEKKTEGQALAWQDIIQENFDAQRVQPAGYDLTVAEVYVPSGMIDLTKEPPKPATQLKRSTIKAGGDTWILPAGRYMARFREKICVPEGCIGLVLPRSTLVRSGVLLATGVWDPGYCGHGMVSLDTPRGLMLKRGEAIAQLVILKAELAQGVYRGRYQDE